MPDYGHDIRFGYFLIPDASDPRVVLETALLPIGSAMTCSPSRTTRTSVATSTRSLCSR
jgi:hypothetical protein